MYKAKNCVLSLFCAITLLLCAPLNSFAESTVNDVSVSKGDKVTFSVNILPLDVKVAAFNMSINYDSSILKVDKSTVVTPAFEGKSVTNCDIDNVIYANAVDGINGFAIKEDSQMFSVTFEVLSDSADCEITYEILELFDLSLESIDPVEYTYSQVKANTSVSSKTQPSPTQSKEETESKTPTSKQSQANSEIVNSDNSQPTIQSRIEKKNLSSKSNVAASTENKDNDNSENIFWLLLGVVTVFVSGLIVTFVIKIINSKKIAKKASSKNNKGRK